MSEEVLVDVHVIYNDNGEFQLIFLTNKGRVSRMFRKQDKMISVFLGLLFLAGRVERKLRAQRAAQQRTGADGAGADESPMNVRPEDNDAGAMGEAG